MQGYGRSVGVGDEARSLRAGEREPTGGKGPNPNNTTLPGGPSIAERTKTRWRQSDEPGRRRANDVRSGGDKTAETNWAQVPSTR